MEIEGKNVLVLGGAGLVGRAVCRRLLPHRPARLTVAARRNESAQAAVDALRGLAPQDTTRLEAAAGDLFARAVPADRRRAIDDLIAPLDEEILAASLLARLIMGGAEDPDARPADIVIDCVNTATAVSYRNLYAAAESLARAARAAETPAAWPETAEAVLASLYLPQLVRHVQLLYEAMRRAGTRAYLKVGTSGTGGMGFNIPYTHGEERPSRLLLSKAAIAGAQSALNFLMARSPEAPEIVKEVKPAALIGWRRIGHGRILEHGREIALYDCPPGQAVDIGAPASLVPEGDFGTATGGVLEGVYIDTGENGVFSADEFTAITAPGQMEMVTPEEIAANVVRELLGGNTGRDVVAALDGAVMGPSYRGGHLRQAARNLLARLEAEHGRSTAFEILGPPRLAKLLFEAELLRRACPGVAAIEAAGADALAESLADCLAQDGDLRRRILSIGIPILLPDGRRLLRGPRIKSEDAEHGWVDLRPANMRRWQARLAALAGSLPAADGDTSSGDDRVQGASRRWQAGADEFDVGEVVAWIFTTEDRGRRDKR